MQCLEFSFTECVFAELLNIISTFVKRASLLCFGMSLLYIEYAAGTINVTHIADNHCLVV